MNNDEFVFDGYDWNHRELLGEGGFGKVFKVRNMKRNEFVAIKQMGMEKFDE